MAEMDRLYRGFTTTDGVDLNYLDTEAGAPLVLLHSWSQCAAVIKHQVSGLAGRCRLVALDQRGAGFPPSPHSATGSSGWRKTCANCSTPCTCARSRCSAIPWGAP
jgi:pimeloyl-ACP methyl ester carboxylesterase